MSTNIGSCACLLSISYFTLLSSFPLLPQCRPRALCLSPVSSMLCLGAPPSAVDRLMVSHYKGLAGLCVADRKLRRHMTLCTLSFAPSRLQALTRTACPMHACYALHHCQIVHTIDLPTLMHICVNQGPILSLSSFFTHAGMHTWH